ncbi:MAG: 50S ribosomal protein L17 [Candidatus Omnitrophica bacterium]|nr:50S ribosomal protein L17 [Candidatus Omnitrophota bacterium]
MARAVLTRERICTTMAKAKEARKFIDRLITLGKKDTLAARRRAFSILCDHKMVSKLFSETSPRFKSRQGGYTRIIPYINRGGDSAALAFLELTEKSREIITNLKVSKEEKEAGDVKKVSEAQTKPVTPTTAEAPTHSKADLKAAPKAAAKPKGTKKLFQRKTGSE